MNYLSLLLDSLVGFVRRNPITCLVLVVAAVAFPQLFKVALWVILVLVAVMMAAVLFMVLRLRRLRKEMEQQIRDAQEHFAGGFRSTRSSQHSSAEGDVSVHRTSPAPEKRVNSNVGEYVEFEEEK